MVCDIVGSLYMFPRVKNRENRLSVQHLAAHHNSILMSQYCHAQRAFVLFLVSAKTWLMPLKAERYGEPSIKLPGAYLREGGLINLPKCHFSIKNYKVEILKQ